MYNLFKWQNCLVVKETVMCQNDVIFFAGCNENRKQFVQIKAVFTACT